MKRVILVVLGIFLLVIAVPMIIGGAVLAAIGSGDDSTVEGRIGGTQSTGNAIVSESINMHWDYPLADRYDVTIAVTSADATKPIFIGYGPTASVDAYLAGVPHTLVREWVHDISFLQGELDRDIDVPGTTTPKPPGDQTFWVAEATGTGRQEIPLSDQTSGAFRFVAMNADGSSGLDVTLYGSANLPFLYPLGIGLLVTGLILGTLGIVLLVWGIRSKPATAPVTAGYGYAPGGPYPGQPPEARPQPASPPPYGVPAAPAPAWDAPAPSAGNPPPVPESAPPPTAPTQVPDAPVPPAETSARASDAPPPPPETPPPDSQPIPSETDDAETGQRDEPREH